MKSRLRAMFVIVGISIMVGLSVSALPVFCQSPQDSVTVTDEQHDSLTVTDEQPDTVSIGINVEEPLPNFYGLLFSEQMLLAIGMVIAVTKNIRNIIGLKGKWAVVITFLVSMLYGFIQFQSTGIEYALGVGLFAFFGAAGIFKGTKLIGHQLKKTNP